MTALQKSGSDKNIEIIKQFYSRLNQNELDSLFDLLAADVIRNEFDAGSYRGLSEIRSHFLQARSTWAEGACEPIEFFSNANKIVVAVHVKVRLKNEKKWIDGHVTDAFLLKDGLVTEFHSFTHKQTALEWAGLSID